MPKDRRHSAIMFTDIVGYTALMGSDVDRVFYMLSRNGQFIKPPSSNSMIEPD